MKTSCPDGRSSDQAFTLIELLVVITVIVILAGLLIPVMSSISNRQMRTVAQSELNQVATAIEAYKARYGAYPQDNPTNVYVNPLYLELVGTTNVQANATTRRYTTLDGTYQVTSAELATAFGVGGLINTGTSLRGNDEQPPPTTFLKEVKSTQVGVTNGVRVLLCSQPWTYPGNDDFNPWRYNSSHPTNNPATFDLWVDVYIAGKTNRISNWSKDPQFVGR